MHRPPTGGGSGEGIQKGTLTTELERIFSKLEGADHAKVGEEVAVAVGEAFACLHQIGIPTHASVR